MSLKGFNQTLTVAGKVTSIDPQKPSFSLRARSGDVFEAVVGPETYYSVLANLDGLDRDRVEEPQDAPGESGIVRYLRKYAHTDRTLVVVGIYQQNGSAERF